LDFYYHVEAFLLIQMKMADKNKISKLLELYQNCKMNGESISLLLETNRGKDTTVTLTINSPGAETSTATPPIRRRKSPSQLWRDTERRKEFFAKKLDHPTIGNTKENANEQKNSGESISCGTC
jgi:hypothetical protein